MGDPNPGELWYDPALHTYWLVISPRNPRILEQHLEEWERIRNEMNPSMSGMITFYQPYGKPAFAITHISHLTSRWRKVVPETEFKRIKRERGFLEQEEQSLSEVLRFIQV